VGGAALGPATVLEERGRSGFMGHVRSLLEAVQMQPGEGVLDVGCGSVVVTRWVAQQTRGANRLVGVDINAYLLREATALSRREGLREMMRCRKVMRKRCPFGRTSSM
jgi:cyclopropane fatty-acyl-phospholipid synthase-like methyltransferase